MNQNYNQAIAEIVTALKLDALNLRIIPIHMTTRATTVKAAGYVNNPDYTVLDYGNKSKPVLVLKSYELNLVDLDVYGKTVRGAYHKELSVLFIDEKWLDKRAEEIADAH